MKKTHPYICLLTLLTLFACTKVETIDIAEENCQKIQFREPFIANAATRSATGDISGANGLKSHGVKIWGEMYDSYTYDYSTATNAFDDGGYRILRWDNGSGTWTYDKTVFWTGEKNYDFVGFAPSEEADVANYENGIIEINGIPVVQTINNSSEGKSGIDYLLSETSTSRSDNGRRDDVGLVFKHLLSRLSLFVWKDNMVKQKIILKDATLFLPNASAKANYVEASHAGPQSGVDIWTWDGHNDIKDATKEEDLATYSSHSMNTTNVEVPACSDALMAEINAQRLGKEFFIAPTPANEDITLYLKISYSVEDENNGTEITKFTKLSGLGKLKQGYKHNIYIRLGEQAITFSIDRVEGWKSDSQLEQSIGNISGHSYGFTAWQDNFDISGIIKVNQYDDVTFDMAKIKAKNDDTVSEAEIAIDGWFETADCSGTAWDEPSRDACFAKFRVTPDPMALNGNGIYVLTLTNQDGEENSADVNINFSDMTFSIKTTEANQIFIVPMATGSTPAPIAIVWGDKSASTIADKYLYNNDIQHSYKSAGIYKIRILSLQTDSESKQIPDFNFGKYPNVTCDLTSDPLIKEDNANGQMLYSVDTPVLYTGKNDLSTMFYGTGLTTIHPNAFTYFSNATKMDGTFFNCDKLTAIPQGLLDQLTMLESMYSTFRACKTITTVPSALLDNQTQLRSIQALFRDCTSLTSLPDGIFAKQLLCYNYKQLLGGCSNLKLSGGLFIDEAEGITKDTRFKKCSSLVRIDNIFYKMRTTDSGTIPDLWNYYFKNKYGFYNGNGGTVKPYYPVSPTDDFTNKADIPECWYKSTTTIPDNCVLLDAN